ncbi:MAG: hypothetical protein K2X66_01075 [Cyanobacteria bacterium]|nr:hypothetical protein [Cyanobacteriota bacterium]
MNKELLAAILSLSFIGVVVLLLMPAGDGINQTNASIEAMKTEKETLDKNLIALSKQLDDLNLNKKLPSDIKIRRFTDDTLQQNIKEMLDKLVQLSTSGGNTLISLEPIKPKLNSAVNNEEDTDVEPGSPAKDQSGVSASVPPPSPAQAVATADGTTPPPAGATSPTAASPIPPAAAPISPVMPGNGMSAENTTLTASGRLKIVLYTVSFRGTFDTLKEFIKSLKTYDELIEISTIEMKNEAGEDRENVGKEAMGDTALSDPARPIVMTLNVKLLLVKE